MATSGLCLWLKQSRHEIVNFSGDAVVVEGGADELAGGDEVHVFFERDVGGELLCARGCRCEFTMQGIVDVEQGEWATRT